jgi:excinuclease UvrABC ATPase subunit
LSDRRRNHNIDVVVDRLIIKSGIERRLAESLEVALGLADEIVIVNTFERGDELFSRKLACVTCGISMPELTPRAFSFNSPHGACTGCQGLGATYDFDPRLIVPDESKSRSTAIAPWAGRSQVGARSRVGLAKANGLIRRRRSTSCPGRPRPDSLWSRHRQARRPATRRTTSR